ncbi:MAG: YqeG family HAD IIIA-type phosphatase [Clostridia bacterium]|nr:YqeG family HAD IIIA-type phosphatase [Clostridia bacterium]
MAFTLVPDYRFLKFDEITPEFLLSIGVRGVLLDIDNTLEPYENPTPSDRVLSWLSALSENGIKAAIVSNNGRERVEIFNENLSLPAYYKAKKPFKKNLLKALADIEILPSQAVFIGDQVFTDVWAARNAGMRAILLPPIRDKRDVFTKFKRLLEKPILSKYERKKRKKENEQA